MISKTKGIGLIFLIILSSTSLSILAINSSFDGTKNSIPDPFSEFYIFNSTISLGTKDPELYSLVDYLSFSPDGRFLASSGYRFWSKVIIWEVATGSKLYTFTGMNPVFSPNGQYIAFYTYNSFANESDGGGAAGFPYPIYLEIRYVETGSIVLSINLNEDLNFGPSNIFMFHIPLQFSPDSQKIASFFGDVIGIWDISSGDNLINYFISDQQNIGKNLIYSPTGDKLVILSGNSYIVFKINSDNLEELMSQNLVCTEDSRCYSGGTSMKYWLDDDTFVFEVNRTINFWVVNSGVIKNRISLFPGDVDSNPIYEYSLSPDGQTLAYVDVTHMSCCWGQWGGEDTNKTIQLWDVKSALPLGVLNGHFNKTSTDDNVRSFPQAEGVRSLSFSPDGSILASAALDGTIRLWNMVSGSGDTDFDGIADVWEQQFGLNSANYLDKFEDPDQDGLTNSMEYFFNTHPLLFDTDGNGLSDAFDHGLFIKYHELNSSKVIFIGSSSPEFFPLDNLSNFWIIFLLSLSALAIISGFIIKSKKRNHKKAVTSLATSFHFKNNDELSEIYTKIIVGLENAKQLWLTQYPDEEIETLIEKKTDSYSILTNIFPRNMQKELKSELRGRTISILIELAYQYPQNAHVSVISRILGIPQSTTTVEIKKLQLLQYIQPTISPNTLKDNRYKHFSLTPKGIIFLHFLKESISLSLANIHIPE